MKIIKTIRKQYGDLKYWYRIQVASFIIRYLAPKDSFEAPDLQIEYDKLNSKVKISALVTYGIEVLEYSNIKDIKDVSIAIIKAILELSARDRNLFYSFKNEQSPLTIESNSIQALAFIKSGFGRFEFWSIHPPYVNPNMSKEKVRYVYNNKLTKLGASEDPSI